MSGYNRNRLLAAEISTWIPLEGKRILEIGCGNGDLLKYIADHYIPESIIGIDSGLENWWNTGESYGDNWRVLSGDAEKLEFDDNSFDAIISIYTFEHIKDTVKTLAEVKRVLKPYGRFYTSFMPIWTSIIGHHFVAPADTTWNNAHLALIPPWGHLYMDEIELASHLKSLTNDKILINQILDWIYRTDMINRKPRQDLLDAIFNCGMVIRNYAEQVQFSRGATPGVTELTADIAARIAASGYRLSDVPVAGMKLCLEKLAAF